ncbi:NAD(P)-dependent oxidoreductase [Acidobacteriota bacterium]
MPSRLRSVFLAKPPEPDHLAYLQSLLDPGIRVSVGPDLPGPADYQILVAGVPDRKHVKASARLRAVIIPWAGLSRKSLSVLLEFPGVAVHNLHHNASAAAEMAAALLLAAAKFVVSMDRSLRAHDWTPRYYPEPSVLLCGKTALILGYGAIGRHVARFCLGMGMKVTATRRSLNQKDRDGDIEVYPPGALNDLLPAAHALLLCLPLTPETEGLIGRDELSLLPREAVLVNIGRGPIVDEEALYRALENGTLHAAGLDVWYRYPKDESSRSRTPPSRFPFHELKNVVMSPHRGGSFGAEELERMRMEALAVLLNTAARGEPIPNRIDPQRGY